MLSSTFKHTVRNLAEQELFDQVGFTSVDPVSSKVADSFNQWLKKNYNGTMEWMKQSADFRLNPKLYFPDVKSMIILLHSYHHSFADDFQKSPLRFASYSHGKDYHDVLKKKLKRLAAKISDITGPFTFKISVDSAPVLERYWAQKAGLGWQGRSSMLISPQLGLRFFISILLTNLEIEPDKPFSKDLCGKCKKCLTACPTRAITSARTVNSNRCISYLTIEHKDKFDGSIPDTFPWIFGCDVCMDVCPWNRFTRETRELKFHPVYRIEEIKDLITNYSETKFSECFAGTAVKRAGADHFRYVLDRIKRFSGEKETS